LSSATLVAGAVQLAGGIVAAPLIPGLVQRLKGRLQGRPGPSALQPYRDLRRLWHKRGVAPVPRTIVYELAPALVAASTLLALVLVPIGGRSPGWPLGDDALVLLGLLTLGRFAITLAAWDTAGAFGLMGAGRDLLFAVAVEAVLLIVLILLALPGHSVDLRALSAQAGRPAVWSEPSHWAAAFAFALAALAEAGRQPVDNPDTHLELTMVHEGPLLEYAGRELAYLQWASAARHWVLLVLASELFVPHPGPFLARLGVLAGSLLVGCVLLAVCETTQAKMRILRVPLFVGAGGVIGLLGLASWFAGGGS
jgi:formate hydrogenlyase subunit 4